MSDLGPATDGVDRETLTSSLVSDPMSAVVSAGQAGGDEPIPSFHKWLDANWDPADTVRGWWARLANAGYSAPGLAVAAGGLGWARADAQQVNVVLAERGCLGPPLGVGLTLVAPLIAQYGSPAQQESFLPGILNGTTAWCQLFSEPEAGSDLAGMKVCAYRHDDHWIVDGEKTWTSGGDDADFGLLLARTDPAVPKHAGISCFLIDMHQPGVELAPLREMTGRTRFNNVTLTSAIISSDGLIGTPGAGWMLAKATLAEERSSYRAAGSGRLLRANPGSCGDLDVRIEQLAQTRQDGFSNVIAATEVARLIDLARAKGRNEDPTVRQELAALNTLVSISGWLDRRTAVPGQGNIAKLLISETFRAASRAVSSIVGAHAMLWGGPTPTEGWAQELVTFAPAPAIYGGTDQIQRNVLGERTLGLPRDPSMVPEGRPGGLSDGSVVSVGRRPGEGR